VIRRQFIAFLGSASIGWPLTSRAQQRGMPVLGVLSPVGATRHFSMRFQKGWRKAVTATVKTFLSISGRRKDRTIGSLTWRFNSLSSQ
jgi:hypothetical protein